MPRIAYAQSQASGQGFARTKKVFGGPTVTLVAGDVLLAAQTALAKIPRGFVVQSMSAVFGACETGTAALTMSIGDAASLARFAAASTTPRAGGTVTLAAGAVGYEFLDDTDILLVTTAAATGLGATPTVLVLMEGYIK